MFSYSLSICLYSISIGLYLCLFLCLCVSVTFSPILSLHIYLSLSVALSFFLSIPVCLSFSLSHSHLCHLTYLASNISVSLYPNLTIFCILLYLTYYFQLSLFHTASPSLCLFFSLVLFIGSFRVQIRK